MNFAVIGKKRGFVAIILLDFLPIIYIYKIPLLDFYFFNDII